MSGTAAPEEAGKVPIPLLVPLNNPTQGSLKARADVRPDGDTACAILSLQIELT